MLDDLKHYRAEEPDAFQIITPDAAVVLLLVGVILGFFMGGI